MDMTQADKTALEIFTSDGTYDVVYKIAKDKIERAKDIFIRNLNLKKDISNEDIGAKIRAFDEGMLIVDSIFGEIGQYRKKVETTEKNPAR